MGPHSGVRTFCEHDFKTGLWVKLKSEAIHICCFLTAITRMFKLYSMGWARHVVRMGDRYLFRIVVGILEGIDHLQDCKCRRKNNSASKM
jgi:hypothetical protein